MHSTFLTFRKGLMLLSAIILPAVLAGQESNTAQGSGTKAAVQLIRLAACYSDTPDCLDYTVIYFDYKATYEFDGQLDALKLMNTDTQVPNLYTITPGGTNLSINGLPPAAKNLCKVALGLKTGAPGLVKFKISEIDSTLSRYRLYLTDTVTGTEYNLMPDKVHEIYLPAGDYAGRFFINVSALSTLVQDYSEDNTFTVYQASGTLTAEVDNLPGRDGTLMVFSLTGQTLYEAKIYGPGKYEFHNNFKDGIYIVSLISGGTRTTKKVFIKNSFL